MARQADAEGSFPRDRIVAAATAFIAAFITFIVYLPGLKNGFVGDWDDTAYIHENLRLFTLNPSLLKWAFTSKIVNNWHPLTVLSYALDYRVWNLDPWGYHLVNIILHAANVFLTALVAMDLSKRITPEESGRGAGAGIGLLSTGFIAALLFGIHPLHVESVAWISERKDVLCAFFFLSSALAYVRYADPVSSRKGFYYAISLLAFILALLSKPMAITLPLVFLILDFYPLKRLAPPALRRSLLEKIPFLVLSFFLALLTLWAQEDAMTSFIRLPLGLRALVAMRASVFYLYKMLVPFWLVPYYPYPADFSLLSYEYAGSILTIVVMIFLCAATFRKRPIISTALAYYLITLLPVIGIIQVGGQAAADRYTYLPSLGPFILVAAWYGRLLEKILRS